MPRSPIAKPEVAPGTEHLEQERQDHRETSAKVAAKAKEVTRESVTRERMPFNSHTKKMDVFIPEDSELARDYHLHKFVDRGGRIDRAKAAGYEFVMRSEVGLDSREAASRSNDLGDAVTWVSGTSEKGDSEITYLMKIRKEYWEEDQAGIKRQTDEVDSAIRRGAVGNSQRGYLRQGSDYDGHPQKLT